MLARKIIVILLGLTALWLAGCQGNGLNGSTSSVARICARGPCEAMQGLPRAS